MRNRQLKAACNQCLANNAFGASNYRGNNLPRRILEHHITPLGCYLESDQMDGIGEFAPRTSKYRVERVSAIVLGGKPNFVISSMFLINSHFSFFRNG